MLQAQTGSPPTRFSLREKSHTRDVVHPTNRTFFSVTDQRYRDWLQLLVDGNQNMIRVWGGGIYEADIFYDICDGEVVQRSRASWAYGPLARAWNSRLAGLHVWLRAGQPCYSAFCVVLTSVTQYPAYDAICDSVTIEAEQAVKRLRHHPSVVIFGECNLSP
jgi:beta-mannosidase